MAENGNQTPNGHEHAANGGSSSSTWAEEEGENGREAEEAKLKESLKEDAKEFMKAMTFRMAPEEAMRPQHSFFDTLETELEDIESGQQSSKGKVQHRHSLVRFQRIMRLSIEWKNLTYTVPIGKKKKRKTKVILDQVSARVPPGRLVAVMGPTGCGKTSLINALAGRIPAGGDLYGEILINNKPRGKGFRSLSAYVMQDDVLFANLTIRETFEFAARMRLPSEVSEETKMALVSQIISELGLSKAQNTRIGNEFIRGISGGERKRTNIGVELLSGASLLFLDEPTSGLDAFQAQNVMESLWVLAGNGRTVITTIHQPRSSIYRMVDLLLLLSEGLTMYFGLAKTATEFFADAGFECPQKFNPADFMLDVVSMDYRNKDCEEKSRRRIDLLADLYVKESPKLTQELSSAATSVEELSDMDEMVVFPNGILKEFWLLIRRAWKQQSRDRIPQVITIAQTIVIGFLLAFLYINMDSSATSGQDEIGLLFFCAIFAAFNAMFGALNSFPAERGVVNRERASKMYHVLPYYCARFICDIPLRVGQGVLFGVIVYWIVGKWTRKITQHHRLQRCYETIDPFGSSDGLMESFISLHDCRCWRDWRRSVEPTEIVVDLIFVFLLLGYCRFESCGVGIFRVCLHHHRHWIGFSRFGCGGVGRCKERKDCICPCARCDRHSHLVWRFLCERGEYAADYGC